MASTWNAGMLEYWNNGQKRITSVLGSRVLGSKNRVSGMNFSTGTKCNI